MVKENEINFYDDAAPLEPHLLYQGEIITGVPLLTMPKDKRWLLLRTGSGIPVSEILDLGQNIKTVKVLDSNQTQMNWDAAGVSGDYAMAQITKHPVLVLSQTCDVQNKAFIQVAPIFPCPKDDSYVGKLIRNEIISSFYLSECLPTLTGNSYADFELIQAVHKSYRTKKDSHFRLSPPNVLKLQQAITRYFGRPNSFDVEADRAPRTASYLCVKCFHFHGVISKIDLQENEKFQVCEKCKTGQWTVQLGSLKKAEPPTAG